MSTDTEEISPINSALVRCSCEHHECENTILLLDPKILRRNTIGYEEECCGFNAIASLSPTDLCDLHSACVDQLHELGIKVE
tara:strand:+ start:1787 stop:2032 length:246 start_codon:yes stop_codon:yes gene_type:complete